MATNYIWDFATDSYLMEKDDSGVTTAVYTNEPVQYGRLISQRRGSETSYYHFDGQGSTRQLTDLSGDVTDEYTYSAFGELVTSSGATESPFQYHGSCGVRADSESGCIYARQRVYSALLGRWSSLDPTPYIDGINLFMFVLNNPIGYVDPSGQFCEDHKHHWFPVQLHPAILRKCPGFPVHAFTTPVQRCWGDDKNCDAHGWLHERRKPDWNSQVQNHLNSSKNCCEFLLLMAADITTTSVELAVMFKNCNKCYSGKVEMVHYRWKTDENVPRSTTSWWQNMLTACRKDPRSNPSNINPNLMSDGIKPAFELELILIWILIRGGWNSSGGPASTPVPVRPPVQLPLQNAA